MVSARADRGWTIFQGCPWLVAYSETDLLSVYSSVCPLG
jgi:hypothetical protein